MVEPVEEIELVGGRITPGVVQVGDTVRRPRNERSDWINRLLTRLEELGYPHAPRFLGIDDQGRDILTFTPGTTTDHPANTNPTPTGSAPGPPHRRSPRHRPRRNVSGLG